ncbi:TlpA family protein disulfide reductase [Pedobacter sp. Hv1]|uniref:TlpA family protein disulfide reductase n=1 Tax=Pedobacter sp. Hv1 TaxID=1740090 RepID=UPI0006D8C973|nr:TlpA family protein disulfide reductase [Pedobacter sp. Hv1]KQB99889.1 hypothetical protein AQF98_15355 [Pedobacter sp. Hv1]
MKKITIYIVLAVLCLNFTAIAQENKAVDVTAKGIQIGQKVPDITITGLYNYKDANGKPATTAKISDFKGKLLILDFWATWCSPCVAMIPKMDSLQKAFGDKIQFLSVTYQTEKEVMPFLGKLEKQRGKHYVLPVVAADKELHQLFPHVYLPHYVWIDGEGIVRAITESYYVNSEYIQKMLTTGNITAKEKVDIPILYDKAKPLFFANYLDKTTVLKQSTFSGYIDGVGLGYSKNNFQLGNNRFERILARNSTIRELYHYAYQKDFKQMLFEVEDTTRIVFKSNLSTDYIEWRRNGNGYCYELINGNYLTMNSNQIMQKDLDAFFTEYKVSIEKRKVKCLALIRTSNTSEIPNLKGESTAQFTGFGGEMTNCPLSVFIARMRFFLQSHPLPLFDDTNYKQYADISIKANLSNVIEINQALEKYSLKFVEKEAYIDMLILSDKKQVAQSK